MLYFIRSGAGWSVVLLIVALLGANYGAHLSLFPSASKDYFALRNILVNDGFLFTAQLRRLDL